MTAPTGWIDERLFKAFDLIDTVLSEADEFSDAVHDLRRAMDLIDSADTILGNEGGTP